MSQLGASDLIRRILLDAMRAQVTDEGDQFTHLCDIGFSTEAELAQMVDDNLFGVVEIMREDLRRHYCECRETCAVDIYTSLLVKLPKWAPWLVRKQWIEKRMIELRVREAMVRSRARITASA